MSTLRVLALLLAGLLWTGPAGAADHLSLMLDWFVNPDHGPILVAKQRGYFDQAGLDVEIVAPADPNDPPKLVAAGQADIGVSYQPQLHIQVDQGLPLVRIGTLIATPLNCLLVLADGPVKQIADLKGRKVGFSVGGFEDALLKAMLARHGLGLDAVELVNVNFALVPALLAKQVDGVIGAFRNFELNQLELQGQPGRAFYPEEEGVPAYDELIFIANRAKLDDPRLGRFLRRGRAGRPISGQPPRRELQAVRHGPAGARRRAEPARLARHAPPLRAPAGGARSRALRPLRRLPRGAGPDTSHFSAHS